MSNLDILTVSTGAIESLKPIEGLNLKAFAFSGGNGYVNDEDMSPLATLKYLSILSVVNRRGYNYRVNDHWNWNDYGHYTQQWLIPKGKK